MVWHSTLNHPNVIGQHLLIVGHAQLLLDLWIYPVRIQTLLSLENVNVLEQEKNATRQIKPAATNSITAWMGGYCLNVSNLFTCKIYKHWGMKKGFSSIEISYHFILFPALLIKRRVLMDWPGQQFKVNASGLIKSAVVTGQLLNASLEVQISQQVAPLAHALEESKNATLQVK